MSIGKLTEVDVRTLWKHEQYDFSDWLAKEANIEYLNDILGLTLSEVDKEVYVGPYRCDLVAKDETSGIAVIIENQLEATNQDAKEEHRSAIEWLNNNTTKDINFFLIEIHAYKIGESDPAPKFEVVEKPNDFVKRSKTKYTDGELNQSQSERLMFWEQFNEVVAARGKPFNLRKASTDHWYDVAVGVSGAHIAINLVNKDNNVVVELYINDDKSLFDSLYERKDEIEGKLGFSLVWDRLDGKKASRIKHYINGLNFDDHSNYDTLMNEVVDKAVLMRDTFKKYL